MFIALFVCSVLAADKPADFLKRNDEWFRSAEGIRIAENILSFQTPRGDWPKNTNTAAARFEGDPATLKGTFDNGATLPELRFLARAFNATKDHKYEGAFKRGLDQVLNAQYPNGGWPQTFPPGKGYDRHITFNDDCMVNLMKFVREVSRDSQFSFLDAPTRFRAGESFNRGIDCILKCQIRIEGKLTGWCAQHDEKDFSPRPARAFELVSLSGAESAGLVRLLMSVEKPSPQIIEAVDAAVQWFEQVKLTGVKQILVEDANAPKGTDKRIIKDETAPPLWARFYDLKTMKPIFVDRDGSAKSSISEIGYERRNGYAWYGTWPAAVLAEYPAWKKRAAR